MRSSGGAWCSTYHHQGKPVAQYLNRWFQCTARLWVLLPEDRASSAARIKKQLETAFSCRLGVIVGDSRTQPMRLGCVGIALGCSGLRPVEDARGVKGPVREGAYYYQQGHG